MKETYQKYNIEIGNIYESNNCGKYKVLNFEIRNKRKGYNIEFINTNFKKWARSKQVNMGSVYDVSISKNAYLGQIFNTNQYGKFMLIGSGLIIKYNKNDNRKHYLIKFINSGNEQLEQQHHVWTGEIRDKYYDNIKVGYTYQSDNQKVTVIAKSRLKDCYIVKGHKNNAIWHCNFHDIILNKFTDYLKYTSFNKTQGYSKYIPISQSLKDTLYDRWGKMISRCYNINDTQYYNYGAKGISVHKNWFRFDNYLLDVIKLEGYNENKILNSKLDLDKDKLQFNLPHSKRVYSKNTCCWLSRKENCKYRGVKKTN